MTSWIQVRRMTLPRKAVAQIAPKSIGSRLAFIHPSKKMGCHPPRKTAVVTAARITTSTNSARKSRPNFIPEYSRK